MPTKLVVPLAPKLPVDKAVRNALVKIEDRIN